VPDTLEDWFRREILPHEGALVRFLSRKWVNASDVQDIRHDIYVRILEAAEHERPSQPKAFLFTVAKNLLIDRARRDRIVAIDLLEDLESLGVLIDEVSPERRASVREQLRRLSDLFDRLPARRRQVVWMRRVEELPQKEIARRLNIAEATVEKHLVLGINVAGSWRFVGCSTDRKPALHAPQGTSPASNCFLSTRLHEADTPIATASESTRQESRRLMLTAWESIYRAVRCQTYPSSIPAGDIPSVKLRLV
jgi:RNA polymerase sigma-70 factor (ECF subfamily)